MNKVIKWFKKTGLTNLAYLAIAVLSLVLLKGFLSHALFGAALGIFAYLNFNVIKKLVVGDTEE